MITIRFAIRFATHVEGDADGQGAIIGANIGSAGKSKGQGILSVAREALIAIQLLTDEDSLQIVSRGLSRAASAVQSDQASLAVRNYDFEALVVEV